MIWRSFAGAVVEVVTIYENLEIESVIFWSLKLIVGYIEAKLYCSKK